MSKRKLADYTEEEFAAVVSKIISADFATDREHSEAVYQFNQLTEHPDGHDLIYFPQPNADSSVRGIVNAVKEWRAANGKSGFKSV
ncbi:Colicin immunity protein / pyocin immunity protein [Enterobacter sp. kpr-6]|uniref:bacteriocin immunity protein n=1 Tax=Enterobacter sp. kpr-6 TaxID=1761782 RepID=UPI0008E53F8A|nr:bacteriocin immunity protein [Enterobacter sp. kpr-6]SFQ98934.1 Colicin immunity protein / pyocin immunity protein [Enterobacter sp. kpr-6]